MAFLFVRSYVCLLFVLRYKRLVFPALVSHLVNVESKSYASQQILFDKRPSAAVFSKVQFNTFLTK